MMVGSSRRALFLVVFILVTCGFLGIVFGQKINPSAAPGGDSDVRDSLRQFTTVYDVVEQNYAEPVNPDKAIYNGAISGMLHVLDPHSNFFDPKAYSLLSGGRGPRGPRSTSRFCAKARKSRWSSRWCAMRFRGTAWTCIS